MDHETPVRAGRHVVQLAMTLVGCLCVGLALAIILVARSTVGRDVYVSEMGAIGQPTARWFEAALLLIVVGGSLLAWAGRGIRSRLPVLRAWTPAISLWIGCGFFLVASQVPCTTGCPLPTGAAFTWEDLIHTVVAVLAFAAACWAMLQTAFARGFQALATLSLVAAISVAIISGIGGLLSLLQFQANFGSRLELVATAIALSWLVTFGVVLAARQVALQRNRLVVAAASKTNRLSVS
jgi:hypothetical protein